MKYRVTVDVEAPNWAQAVKVAGEKLAGDVLEAVAQGAVEVKQDRRHAEAASDQPPARAKH
jgi:hypothetical protein